MYELNAMLIILEMPLRKIFPPDIIQFLFLWLFSLT